MILVTVGSSEQPFTRLLRAMDELAPRLGESVVMQSGRTPYDGRHTECLGYVSFDRMHELAEACRVLIGHASTGAVLIARRYGKPLILVPRDPVLNETFDDHQFQMARAMEGRSRMIEVVYDVADLEAAIRRAQAKTDQGLTYEPFPERERLLAAIRAAALGWRRPGPLRALVIGSSLSGNRGAMAMTLVAADQLRAMAPDCHVRLLSTYPEEDAAMAEREGIELVPAPPARTATRTLARSAVAVLFGWRPCGPLADDVIRAYAEADVLVDLSGISFSDDLPLRGWLAGVVWMMPALATRTPVVKLSQAMGPFGKRLNRWAARALLGRCAVLMARGQATADQVRALLGRRAACRVAADVAFLLEPAADDRVDAALDAAGAPADGYVGVSASSMVDDKTTAVGRSGAYRATMADLVTHIRATTGRAVVLVPHAAPQRAGLRADGEVCREVADALESRDGVFVLDERLDARVTKGVISRSDVYVASRFHAMVAALGSGVPVLVVGWGHKYREVMEAFGLGPFVLDFASATDVRLREAFDELWGGREALREQVGAARPAVLDSARENFRRLRAFLERRGLP